MSSGQAPPKYGLILRQSKKIAIRAKPSVFDDSDDEPQDEKPQPKPRQDFSQKVNQQVSSQIEKALAEDATTFQYDEVYDAMAEERRDKQQTTKSKNAKEPKYALNLIKAAVKRQLENEVREERKQAKERLKEGDEFDDKEVFVTSAYRKRLEELRTFREELELRDRIDEMTDVTKQKDLSGFYRKLLHEVADSPSSKATAAPAATDEAPSSSAPAVDHSKRSPPSAREASPNAKEPEISRKSDASRHRHRRATSPVAPAAEGGSSGEEDEELKRLMKSDKQRETKPKESASQRQKRFFTPSPPPVPKGREKQSSSRRERRCSPSPSRRHSSSSSKRRRHSRERHRDNQRDRRNGSSRSRHDHRDSSSHRKSSASSSKVKSENGENQQQKKMVTNEVLGTVDPALLKNQRMQKLREIFAHRNDAEAVEAYKQRYLERRRLHERSEQPLVEEV